MDIYCRVPRERSPLLCRLGARIVYQIFITQSWLRKEISLLIFPFEICVVFQCAEKNHKLFFLKNVRAFSLRHSAGKGIDVYPLRPLRAVLRGVRTPYG